MSGVMSFGGASDKHRMWFCAGWGFSGFLDHMIECYQGDDEFVRILEVAKYHNGLHLELEEEKLPGLKPRILGAILNVAQKVVDGKHITYDNFDRREMATDFRGEKIS